MTEPQNITVAVLSGAGESEVVQRISKQIEGRAIRDVMLLSQQARITDWLVTDDQVMIQGALSIRAVGTGDQTVTGTLDSDWTVGLFEMAGVVSATCQFAAIVPVQGARPGDDCKAEARIDSVRLKIRGFSPPADESDREPAFEPYSELSVSAVIKVTATTTRQTLVSLQTVSGSVGPDGPTAPALLAAGAPALLTEPQAVDTVVVVGTGETKLFQPMAQRLAGCALTELLPLSAKVKVTECKPFASQAIVSGQFQLTGICIGAPSRTGPLTPGYIVDLVEGAKILRLTCNFSALVAIPGVASGDTCLPEALVEFQEASVIGFPGGEELEAFTELTAAVVIRLSVTATRQTVLTLAPAADLSNAQS